MGPALRELMDRQRYQEIKLHTREERRLDSEFNRPPNSSSSPDSMGPSSVLGVFHFNVGITSASSISPGHWKPLMKLHTESALWAAEH